MKIVLLLTAVVVLVLKKSVIVVGNRSSKNRPVTLDNHRKKSTRNIHGAGTDTHTDGSKLPSPPFGDTDDEDSVCVAITGGAGQIAYSLLPLILHGQVFGEGRKVRLRLLDVEACGGALEGIAMEIRDCHSNLVTEVITTTDPETAFAGADVAILLGGFPRLPGMERQDLIAKNVPIMAEHGRAIARRARAGVRVLVVANPACTNCLVASMCAPSVPRHHFSSLARLDQERLAASVAERVSSADSTAFGGREQDAWQAESPPPSSVQIRGVFIWGNHSPTMWPDVSNAEAKVCGAWVPVERLAQGSSVRSATAAPDESDGSATRDTWVDDWVTSELAPAVRERGTRVIEVRGKSSALSAANAIAKHLRDWLYSPAVASVSHGAVAEAEIVRGMHGPEVEHSKTDTGVDTNGLGGRNKKERTDRQDISIDSNKRGRRFDGDVSLEGVTPPPSSLRSGASVPTWEARGCCWGPRPGGHRREEGAKERTARAVSMGVFSDGNPYGVPDGLVYSFPVQCGEGGHRILEGFEPNKDMLEASTRELLEERRQAFEVLGGLGLLPSTARR